jgi:hypothetical protein
VKFGFEIGEYSDILRSRRVFQRLLPERPTPERYVETYYLTDPVREHRGAETAPAPVNEISGRD